MEQGSLYEYHNDKLGVQARFIFSGRNAHANSLGLITYDGLHKKIVRGKIAHLRAQAPNQPMLVEFATLPYEWQRLLIKEFGEPAKKARQSFFEKHYQRDIAAFTFFTNYQYADGSFIKRTSECNRVEEYTLNASVLNLIRLAEKARREYRNTIRGRERDHFAGEKPVPVWESICRDADLFRAVVPHTLPANPARLRERLSKYIASSYESLIHKGKGNDNARIVTEDIELFLNDLFATQTDKPTRTEVFQQYEGFLSGYVEVINNETGELYNPKDFKPLSRSTVTAYLAKWSNRIATYAIRSGNRQTYMSQFKPYHSLEQPKLAGSIISIDDRQPPFEYEKGRRMWFYNGIDLGSEAFICWVYGKTKDGIILDFYRQLVRNFAQWGFNLPAELEAEMSLNSQFVKTFLQEGAMFQYVRIEANNARGKRIEAYYRPLRYEYEKKREGWLARPFAISEANQQGAADVPVIPYNQIVEGCLRDIETWNNTEHSKIKGKTRWEVFCETQNPNVRPTNYRAIIPYLGYRTQTSCRTGIIKLQNGEYLLGNDGLIATGDHLINLMQTVEGRDVNVYWLDGNNGHILKAYVYIGEQLICEAIAKPTYNRARIEQTPEGIANRELMSKYVATITAYGNRRRNEIEQVTVIDNTPRTLNNKFSIAGLSRYEMPQPTEVEILSDSAEFDFMGVESGFNAPLSERF